MGKKQLKVGQDDGYGNKVGNLEISEGSDTGLVFLRNMEKGDEVEIRNKEGCVIATYIVR